MLGFIVLIALLSAAPEMLCRYLDIAQLGHEQYQDIIINGKVVQQATHNHKDCESRYQILKSVLECYNRPFTMIDIGASQGYYSFRAAYDYKDSSFVMIEGNNEHYPLIGTQLLDLCKENSALDNIIFLNKPIELADLQRLQECEHFDVIVAFNIIHWFKDSWKEIADAILNLGDTVVIETPPQETGVSDDQNRLRLHIEEYLISKGAEVLGHVKRHTSDAISTIYLVQRHKQYLERKSWLSPKLSGKTHRIYSDFNQKKLHKKVIYPENTYQMVDWMPGINLITFKMYRGAYPTYSMLVPALDIMKNDPHTDCTINNMIVQGNHIILIDYDDPTHGPGGPGGGRDCSLENYYKHCKILALQDPEQVEHYFWNHLVK
jgi:hypothetical protein